MAREALQKCREALNELQDWSPQALHQCIVDVSAALDLKMGKVAQPLRVAITGRAASPSIDVTLHLTGKVASLRRIDRALDYIKNRTDNDQSQS